MVVDFRQLLEQTQLLRMIWWSAQVQIFHRQLVLQVAEGSVVRAMHQRARGWQRPQVLLEDRIHLTLGEVGPVDAALASLLQVGGQGQDKLSQITAGSPQRRLFDSIIEAHEGGLRDERHLHLLLLQLREDVCAIEAGDVEECHADRPSMVLADCQFRNVTHRRGWLARALAWLHDRQHDRRRRQRCRLVWRGGGRQWRHRGRCRSKCRRHRK
mmetsp:Transcript_81116/g.233089  ORF Transcript_81116/g.233089 Transcript_81116/m.233089 type:complete len:213 (-) Transcript_81116:503-1141(-)